MEKEESIILIGKYYLMVNILKEKDGMEKDMIEEEKKNMN